MKYLCAIKDLYDKSIITYKIFNFIDLKLVLDTVKQAIETNETNTQQNINPEIDAIDMRIFDVQFDRVAVINRSSEQDHGVAGEFEEDVQELFIL